MPKMIIMRGLPGSGKSTAAGVAKATHSAVVLSTDEYFTIGGKYYFDPMKLDSAHRWNQWRSRQLIAVGVNIIIDNTNTQFKEFKSYAENALQAGYEVTIQEPTTNWATDIDALLRFGTHNVPRETLEKMLERYEDADTVRKKLERLKEKYAGV